MSDVSLHGSLPRVGLISHLTRRIAMYVLTDGVIMQRDTLLLKWPLFI